MEFTDEELANEEWRLARNLEQYYEVSSLGRVRSKDRTVRARDGRTFRRTGKLLSLKPMSDGNVVVHLGVDGNSMSMAVHRLVAETFIPCDDHSRAVLHRNLIRNDNRVENLYWGAGKRRCDEDGEYNPEETVAKHDTSVKSLPGEEWRDVVGFEGLYLVSSAGRVMSLKTNIILRQSKKENGYLKVTLRKDGRSINKHVHRLVGEAFLECPDGCYEINHKDENKENNEVGNLEWCDQAYNNAYGTGPSRRVAKWDPMKANQKRIKPVLQYDLDGNLIRRWGSQAEASRELGFSAASISGACNRKNECQYMYGVAHGYRWDFEGVDYEAA